MTLCAAQLSFSRSRKATRDADEGGGSGGTAASGASLSKKQWLETECKKPEYQSPCLLYQKWECVFDGQEMRIRKCRHRLAGGGFNPHKHFRKQLGSGQLHNSNCVCRQSEGDSGAADDGHQPFDSDDFNSDYDYAEMNVFEAQHKPGVYVKALKEKRRIDSLEKRLQRKFLKDHVGKRFRPIFIGGRSKRRARHSLRRTVDSIDSVIESLDSHLSQLKRRVAAEMSMPMLMDFAPTPAALPNEHQLSFDVDGVYKLSKILDANLERSSSNTSAIVNSGSAGVSEETLLSFEKSVRRIKSTIDREGGCTIFTNHSVSCNREIYQNKQVWKEKKERLDALIKKLQVKLEQLRGIRRHLKQKRPAAAAVRANQRRDCVCHNNHNANRNGHRSRQNDHHLASGRSRFSSGRRQAFRWRLKEDRQRRRERKLRRKSKFQNTTCNFEKMNCFTHDNDHWKTAPFWTSKAEY